MTAATSPQVPVTDLKPTPLVIAFGGEELQAMLVDGKPISVKVRALPNRYLTLILLNAENEAALIELTTYLPGPAPEGYPEDPIRPPTNWHRVPQGWADNLDQVTHERLLASAQSQNFSRAAKWAERQIAAKKFVMPLNMASEEAIRPLMEKMLGMVVSSLESVPGIKKLMTMSSTDSPSPSSSPQAA